MIYKLIQFLKILIVFYILVCVAVYFFQEKLLFFPQKLEKNFNFNFPQEFSELNFKTKDGKLLNGLLFKAAKTKGLIFYLHGNAGSLSSWGTIAKTYTDLNYDIFILDYRGFGKSEGKINNPEQLFEDNQMIYNILKKEYKESNLIVIGYSIGTGLASKLASDNAPKYLILQAPYYNLTDVMQHKFWFLPTFLLKYKFSTNEYLKDCKMPITIFHGTKDKVIYYGSSLKLKNKFKNRIRLIALENQGHNGITNNNHYRETLKTLLGSVRK